MNINKTDLKYLFRDFTDIGKPTTGTKISFLTDDQVYKWSPDRYNFYMQILDEVMNPDSKVVDTVLSIENRTRRSREKIMENIRNVANAIGYLDQRQKFYDAKQSGGEENELKTQLEKLEKEKTDTSKELNTISSIFNKYNDSNNSDYKKDIEPKITTITNIYVNEIYTKINNLIQPQSSPTPPNKNNSLSLKQIVETINNGTQFSINKNGLKDIYNSYINLNNKIYELKEFMKINKLDNTKISDIKLIYFNNNNKLALQPIDKTPINGYKKIIDTQITNLGSKITETTSKLREINKTIDTLNEEIKKQEIEQYYQNLHKESTINLYSTSPKDSVEKKLTSTINRELKAINTPASQWIFEPNPKIGPPTSGGGLKQLMFKDVASELDKNASDTDQIKRTLVMYDNDPVLSPKVNELKYMDKVVFIAMTFLIRAITLFIVQWGLNTRMLTDFVSAFIFYIFVYMALFILWCFLVNATSDNVFFKVLFYYVNLDGGSGVYARYKTYGRIFAHFLIFLLLIPVPFIVKDTVNANLYSTAESEQSVYEARIKSYRYISQFTFFIWILTSVIAFSTP